MSLIRPIPGPTMLRLPNPPHRTAVRSFWLSLGLCGGGASALLLAVLGLPIWPAAAVGLALLLPLLSRPEATRGVYRFWNRVAAWFGRRAGAWVTRVTYHVVLSSLSRADSGLDLDRPRADRSMWSTRGSLSPSSYARLHSESRGTTNHGGWVSSYLSWAVGSRRPWTLALLPFLLLLRALGDDGEIEASENIYTLY